VDALIHAYWLTVHTWPARDTRALSRPVLNADVPFTPRVLAPVVVALAAGAAAVLAKAGLLGASLPAWLPGWVPVAGTLAVAAGSFLRGGAGVSWAAGIGARRDTAFYWLNLTAYTRPVCSCVAPPWSWPSTGNRRCIIESPAGRVWCIGHTGQRRLVAR
jgi:hypothetical protein